MTKIYDFWTIEGSDAGVTYCKTENANIAYDIVLMIYDAFTERMAGNSDSSEIKCSAGENYHYLRFSVQELNMNFILICQDNTVLFFGSSDNEMLDKLMNEIGFIKDMACKPFDIETETKNALYRLGEAYLENEDYANAYSTFESLGDYLDSASRMKEAIDAYKVPNNPKPEGLSENNVNEIKGYVFTTGGDQGNYYKFGSVLARMVTEKTGTEVTAVTSGGSKANIDNLKAGGAQFGFVQSDIMAYGYEGSRMFEETGAEDFYSMVAALYKQAVQIVTLNPGIKTVADLKGKTVVIGAAGSGVYFNAIDVLSAYGLTEADINPIYQSFGDSTEALQSGQIDAAFVVSSIPTTAIKSFNKTVYLVSMDDAHINTLIASCPYYSKCTVPATTYNMPEDVTTVAVGAMIIARNDVPEQDVYNFVSGIFENIDELKQAHDMANELTLNYACSMTAVPYHPGAARYYSEKGFSMDKKNADASAASSSPQSTSAIVSNASSVSSTAAATDTNTGAGVSTQDQLSGENSIGSGTIRSDTGTGLNIHADWSAVVSGQDTADITVTVYADCNSLYTTASPDALNITLDEQYASLPMPAIERDGTEGAGSVMINSYTFTVPLGSGEVREVPLDVIWIYRGSYNGVSLDEIGCGETLVLKR